MLKKAALALFGLALAITFITPAKAAAEVNVGVAIGAPAVYGAVDVAPAPYVAYPSPYVYAQPYVAYDAPAYYGGYYGYYGRPYWRHDHGWHRGWRERGYYGRGRHGWHGEGRWEH